MDHVTLAQARALRRHWANSPPVHKMLAAFVGYKPPPSVTSQPEVDAFDPSGIGELIGRFPGGIVPADR